MELKFYPLGGMMCWSLKRGHRMPETFCYLLGAGASCNVLPVTENFPEKMKKFLSDYDEFRADVDKQKPSDPKISTDPLRYEARFKESMTWLMPEVKNHASVDTFAKMLYLTGDYNSLARLKATLATYLVMAQAMYGTDPRYDGFLATILQRTPMRLGPPFIPEHIRIVTWNYDLQLEKAFYRYSRNADGNQRKNILVQAITFNRQIQRINGLAGLSPPGQFSDYTMAALQPFSIETALIALKMYSTFVDFPTRVFFDIQFAWEEQDAEVFKGRITPAVKDTTILVVIGYSFPYFNREADKILLKCMSNLKKIYIQVLKPEHDEIKDRLQSILSPLPKVEYVFDEKRFKIPYEL